MLAASAAHAGIEACACAGARARAKSTARAGKVTSSTPQHGGQRGIQGVKLCFGEQATDDLADEPADTAEQQAQADALRAVPRHVVCRLVAKHSR